MWTFPGYTIGEAPDWQALATRYDWLAAMRGVRQDSKWHGEGDVFVHTQMVAEAMLALPEYQSLDAQDKHILFAAALLHDVEKRSTTTEEVQGGRVRIVSPRHAKKGEYSARQMLFRDIPAPFAVREQIAKLVRLHGLPLWALRKSNPQKAVIEASLVVNTAHLALLAKADVLGRVCPDREALLVAVELFAEQCRECACYGEARAFSSAYARYDYLNRAHGSPDYEPYDDLACTVTMLCALPGMGKDTYIREHLPGVPVLSLDDIRREHGIDPTDKKQRGTVIQLAREQARVYLRGKRDFVFNATNLTREMRGKWTALFADYHARIRLIYLEVPYQQWLRQNRERAHAVPEKALHELLGKLELPGYGEAHEVRFVVQDGCDGGAW